MNFWEEQCPKRGPALAHAHSSRCDPKSVHPKDDMGNGGNRHPMSTCCHCEMNEAQFASWLEEQERPARPTADHEFQFTIAGRCAKCQRTEQEHPIFRAAPPEGECAVDHDSITTAMLIGDAGLEWRRCPICGVHVEPYLATGIPKGKPSEVGRGILLNRQKERLNAVADRVIAMERYYEWEKTHA